MSVQANKELHLNCSSLLYQRECVHVCCTKLDYWTRAVCWAVARCHTKVQTRRGFPGLVWPKVPSSVNWNLKTFDRRCRIRCSSLSRGRYFRGGWGALAPFSEPCMPGSPSNYHPCTPLSPYQSSSSRLCFFPLSMSAWPVLCTLTRALIHQGYITWEPPELRAIPFSLFFFFYNFL